MCKRCESEREMPLRIGLESAINCSHATTSSSAATSLALEMVPRIRDCKCRAVHVIERSGWCETAHVPNPCRVSDRMPAHPTTSISRSCALLEMVCENTACTTQPSLRSTRCAVAAAHKLQLSLDERRNVRSKRKPTTQLTLSSSLAVGDVAAFLSGDASTLPRTTLSPPPMTSPGSVLLELSLTHKGAIFHYGINMCF